MADQAAPDPYDLQRFVAAQDAGDSYRTALAEVRSGRKHGHWIWYVFPQLDGLGMSGMSKRYGISGLPEARDYLAHDVLGPRLLTITEAARETAPGDGAESIFGAIDAIKLRSSMTLFGRAAPDRPVFGQVIDRFFGGVPDPQTEALLGRDRQGP